MSELGLGIHKAICSIKAAIAAGGGVQKERSAPMGYKFRGIEDFDNILCGMTAEHGVVMYPRVVDRDLREGVTAKGGYQLHVFLTIDWTFVCADDGSSVVVTTIGEAMDTQDKAVNKAMQASRKYAILMVLMIPTAGDDTEIYVPEPKLMTVEIPAVVHAVAQAALDDIAALPPLRADDSIVRQGPTVKRTRGPNKPKEAPAEITQPAEVLNGAVVVDDVADLIGRIENVQTFPLLYAFAQDMDSQTANGSSDRAAVFEAVKSKAIALFAAAQNAAGVQEGFELVSALGQPIELKQAANAAYARYRK